MIKRLFSPPIFENAEDNFRAKFINGFAWTVIVLLGLALIPNVSAGADANAYTTGIVLVSLIAVMFVALYALRQGNLSLSGWLIVILGWLGLSLQALIADGVRDVIVIAYIAVSLLASIIISWRTGGIVMLLSVCAIWTLAILEVNGVIHPRFQGPIPFSRDLSLIFVSTAVLIYFSATSLREATSRFRNSEQDLLASNEKLQELNQTLEERVNQRTAELDAANRFNLQRAHQFEAITQVVHIISTIQDLDTLLPRIAQLVSEQLGAYHVGIFLFDAQHEFAVLRAANSEGGRTLIAENYKLPIGQTGVVGFASVTGQPRIALDVGPDAVLFDNPQLPQTRSEIALPLRYAGPIIGVLDVQSDESNAFDQGDVDSLITLADQISIAINNTLLLEEARRAFAESQDRSSKSALESWKVMQPQSLGLGFELVNSSMRPLEKPLEGNHIQEAIATEKSATGESGDREISSLAIPIRLRGQLIGIMNLRPRNNYVLSADDTDIAEAVAERVSIAIETATLLQSTQHRADIERITTDISTKISSSTRFETILQTAAQELSRALGGSDVIVQIEPNSLEIGN